MVGCCYVFRFCLMVVCPGNRYGGGVGLMDPGRVTPDMGDLDSNGADNEDSAGALADKILREIVNAATSISIKVRQFKVHLWRLLFSPFLNYILSLSAIRLFRHLSSF